MIVRHVGGETFADDAAERFGKSFIDRLELQSSLPFDVIVDLRFVAVSQESFRCVSFAFFVSYFGQLLKIPRSMSPERKAMFHHFSAVETICRFVYPSFVFVESTSTDFQIQAPSHVPRHWPAVKYNSA
jgi:hypothetical protein